MLCLLVCVLSALWEAGSTLPPDSADYVVTLNSTNSATVYCFSDYLSRLKLETFECAECKRRVRDNTNCTRTNAGQIRPAECRCKEDCIERERRCPTTAAEHSTCLTKVKSRDSVRGLVCTGHTEEGGVLTINIQIVRHQGGDLCYGSQSGTPLNETHLLESGAMYQDPRTNVSYWKSEVKDSLVRVSYKSPILCINSSHVSTLNAGHLLGAGYTLGGKASTGDHHEEEHEEEEPDFEQFCRVDRPKLWKRKEGFTLGTVYQCNGTYHLLKDKFPCLQFPPTDGFRLPSLENCSPWEMVGIVVAMIVAMVLCYTVLIACVKLWVYVCKCASVEKIDIPLALADSSTNSRTTLAGSAVVKQESRDSVLSGVAMPPPPAVPPQQPPLSEGNEQTTPVTPVTTAAPVTAAAAVTTVAAATTTASS